MCGRCLPCNDAFLASRRVSSISRRGSETSLFNALRMDRDGGRADFTMEANIDALSNVLEALPPAHRKVTCSQQMVRRVGEHRHP